MADALQALEQGLAAAAQQGDVDAARRITAEMTRLMKEANPGIQAPDLGDQARAMAARDTGAAEAAMIGAGRTADKTVAGVKQGFFALPQYPLVADLTKKAVSDLAAEQAEKDKAYAPLAKAHPVSTAVGEAAPYVAIPASAGVLPAAAITGGVEAAQYGTKGERTARGIFGGTATAVGGFLGNTAAKVIAPVTRRAAREGYQGGLDAAERIGMPLTVGESTGSSFLRRLEDKAAQVPGGSGVMAEHAEAVQLAKNAAAARAIGEEADELTPQVIDRAAKRIGKVFEDLRALPGRPIQLGADVVAAADEVLRTQAKMLPHQQDANLIKIAQDAKALAANKGRIDGQTYQLQRSGLSDAAFEATVGTNKKLYGKLLEAIDNSAEASLRAAGNDALAESLKVARPQWANLQTLVKGSTIEGGDASAARIASTLRTNNPLAFRRGSFMGKDMGDLATVGEVLKPLREGSQTYGRDAAGNVLHALWSWPFAKAATSRAATMYPRGLGNTESARLVAEIANPSTRAAVAAALQQSALPLLPVAAE